MSNVSHFLTRLLPGKVSERAAAIVMGAMVVIVLVLVSVVSISLETIRKAGDDVQLSASVERAAADVLTAALNQQAGLRGYSESGNSNFLAPFEAGRDDYARGIENLRVLTRQSAIQRERIDRLSSAMTMWDQTYAIPQRLAVQNGLKRPELAEIGKTFMDDVREIADSISQHEKAIAAQRSQARQRAILTAYLTLFVTAGLLLSAGLALGGWAFKLMTKTERQTQEYAEAKLHMLAIVGHEIRTPLNGMLGMLQALCATPLTEEQQTKISIAVESGQNLTALLDDLLDVSKINAGRFELVQNEFSLNVIVQNLEAIFRPVAQAKGIALTVEVADQVGDIWVGDKVRLSQILSNLVSNAIKFTAAGEVNVTFCPISPSGFSFSVSDTGIGIASEALAKLFTPFVQAEAQTAHRFGGTGLGLAISRSLAQLMGGEIRVESVEGEGTTFTVSIPLQQGAETIDTEERFAMPTSSLRVLAADDNAVNRQVLTAVLSSSQMEVALVENGNQAVASWTTGSFDVVLLDLRMPVCDGLEAARRIRELELGTARRTPLILLTGDLSPEVKLLGSAAGFDAFVGKPLNVEELINSISGCVGAGHLLEAA